MSIPRRARVASVLVASFVGSQTASVAAQSAPPAPQQPAEPARTAPPAPGVSPPTDTRATPAPQTANKLQIDDPMLVDVPPAQRTLTDWREAMAIVSTRDVEFLVGLQEVERARGLARQALAPALPQADATGSVIFHLIQGDGLAVDDSGRFAPAQVPLSPVAQAQLTVTQQILAPRVWYGIGTADAQVELAKLNVQDRRRTLLAAAASAVVSVVTAERVAEINRVGLRAALERLELTKRRTAIGSGTQLDVVRFEQDVAIARSTLVQGDENLRQARENLGLALGVNETYGVPQGFTLDGVERDAAALCKPTSATDRADLLAARKAIEIAERGRTDADLRYLPTAQVSTTATYASQILQTTKHYAWSIQGLITIPIWDGGERYGAHRSASAETEQARLREEVATRRVNVEVNRATRAVEVSRQALDVAKKSRDLAADVERLSRTSFEVGAGTSFDLVDASRRLREAELTLAVRELELVQAKVSALLAAATCTL